MQTWPICWSWSQLCEYDLWSPTCFGCLAFGEELATRPLGSSWRAVLILFVKNWFLLLVKQLFLSFIPFSCKARSRRCVIICDLVVEALFLFWRRRKLCFSSSSVVNSAKSRRGRTICGLVVQALFLLFCSSVQRFSLHCCICNYQRGFSEWTTTIFVTYCGERADLRFVKKITWPDFRAKYFTH